MKNELNLAAVVNNFGEFFDGVGAYGAVQAENFPEWIHVSAYSATCKNDVASWKRFTCLGMTCEIMRVLKDLKKKRYDVVLTEYPFVEWNPLIVLAWWALSRKARKTGCKMVISLHEYDRVNGIRKTVIRMLSKTADMLFVSNEEMLQSISIFHSCAAIRSIPTNIYDQSVMEETIERDYNAYVYFGLINKAKAFDEMLEGWDRFNSDLTKKLYVISSSKISTPESQHKNVQYIQHAPDEDIIRIMRKCAYCVVPVRPYVDMKNTTFKTGCIAGCISVGCFSEEYKKLPFVIPMREYDVDDFLKAFERSAGMTVEETRKMSEDAVAFGKQYMPGAVANVVAAELGKLVYGGISDGHRN